MNEEKKSKLRFGVFDAVIIIVVLSLLAGLVFRFVADKNLFAYDTEQYTVTVKAYGLQYTTIDMLASDENVYLESGKELGKLRGAPTVTPKLEYYTNSEGDMIPSYYPDNTLVDITTEIDCSLVSSGGMLTTRDGIHIAAGAKLDIHTQSVNLTVEIVSVNKTASE